MKRIQLISELADTYSKNHNLDLSEAWLIANETLDLIEKYGMKPPKTTKYKKVNLVDESGQLYNAVQVREWDDE